MQNTYFPIPEKVLKNARTGLILKERGFIGGSASSWNIAEQLSEDTYIKYIDVMRLKMWFERNGVHSKIIYESWKKDGKPTHVPGNNTEKYSGAVDWLMHGGSEGKKWIYSVSKQH
jgi:hypothetical protein